MSAVDTGIGLTARHSLTPGLLSLVGNVIETGIQDFKRFSSTNPANWSNDDKKSLSEALSGFENSDGGTIVWGVNCKNGLDGNNWSNSLCWPDKV